jgi:hypothetical protein
MKPMKKLLLAAALAATALSFTACEPALIQAQMRASAKNSNMITRCEEVDMRSNSELEEVFSKYDGWRLIYISEYTTGNKIGTSGAACFEKPAK